MKRLKGPELKMSELKVPGPVADVFYDLRDRRLLPLVALVVVAIAAVPFLLGGDAEEPVPTTAETIAPESEADTSAVPKLAVVEATPGLRDYRKRLARRKPTNPFKQHYTGPVLNGAQLEGATGGGGSTTSTTVTTTETGSDPVSEGGSTPPAEPGPPPREVPAGDHGSGGDHKGDTPKLTLFAFAIKVSIVSGGGKEAKGKKKERAVKERVLPHTPLPGKKAPVVTYMGPSDDAKKALLLVSTKVESVFGDTRCVTNEDVCQLVEVEPGFPVTFVYGANEVRYTINVIKIEPIVTGTL